MFCEDQNGKEEHVFGQDCGSLWFPRLYTSLVATCSGMKDCAFHCLRLCDRIREGWLL